MGVMPWTIAVPDVAILAGPEPADADAVVTAINESLEYLRPWMAWAQEPATLVGQATRLSAGIESFSATGECSYTIFDRERLRVIGGCGLHDRRPITNGREIGYWLHPSHTGRGVATASASALTRAAFERLGLDQMLIHCDEANTASAAVPRRLGYAHIETRDEERAAPNDTNRTMVWAMTADEWPSSPGAAIAATVTFSDFK